MDLSYPTEVSTPARVTAVIILLGVGVFQFVVFFLEGLFSTDPVPIRWWLIPANLLFAVIIALIVWDSGHNLSRSEMVKKTEIMRDVLQL